MKLAASIVIPTLNEEKYLPALLNSLKEVSFPLEIIVVDGNSTDDTVGVVEKFIPSFSGDSTLRLLTSERGIAFQRNLGAAQAKYDVLIFCDADIVFPSMETYQKIVSEFVEKKYVAAAPIMLSLESGKRFQLIYGILSLSQKILLFFGKPYFPGACLLTTKETFTQIGGFDTMVLLGEDVDYSLKTSKLGSCGLLNAHIQVSSRRVIKYGYWWLLKELPNVFGLVTKGRINQPENLFYPFGDFGDLKK